MHFVTSTRVSYRTSMQIISVPVLRLNSEAVVGMKRYAIQFASPSDKVLILRRGQRSKFLSHDTTETKEALALANSNSKFSFQ